jgi:hypothetical protein
MTSPPSAGRLVCAAVAAMVGLAYPLVAGWFADAALATSVALVPAGGMLLMASHISLGYCGCVLLFRAPAP